MNKINKKYEYEIRKKKIFFFIFFFSHLLVEKSGYSFNNSFPFIE